MTIRDVWKCRSVVATRALLLSIAFAGCSGPAAIHESAAAGAVGTRSPRPRLVVELLALDLSTCGRCAGTSASLDDAMATVASALRRAEVDVEVRRVVVSSAEQAESLRFTSSPTIRVNGRDVPVALRESACGDCASICGAAGGIDCRVWIWRGKEYNEAPAPMIVDAILRGYADAWTPVDADAEPFALPENLRRFFEAKASDEVAARRG